MQQCRRSQRERQIVPKPPPSPPTAPPIFGFIVKVSHSVNPRNRPSCETATQAAKHPSCQSVNQSKNGRHGHEPGGGERPVRTTTLVALATVDAPASDSPARLIVRSSEAAVSGGTQAAPRARQVDCKK
eukprot:2165533-Prymnesium_polylepis.2